MSWIKENYEKAALGGAAVVLAGVAATCFLGGDEKPSGDALSYDHNDDPGTELLAEVATVLEARKTPAAIRELTIKGREVDLHIGQRLYMADGSDKPVNIAESPAVHQGIPNVWWTKHGIDPSFANAPERDADKDGFTNREEHVAQTNPADADSYPSPLSKVVGNGVDLFKMQMRWSNFDQKSLTIYYRDNKRIRFSERVNFGEAFFKEGSDAVKGRFVLGSEVMKAQDHRGREQDAYEITDTTPRYKGTPKEKVTLLRRGPFDSHNEIQDRSVTLTLHALGKESETFVVREYEKFALPFDLNAKDRPYQVTKIEPVAGQKDVFTVVLSGTVDGQQESKTLTVRKN